MAVPFVACGLVLYGLVTVVVMRRELGLVGVGDPVRRSLVVGTRLPFPPAPVWGTSGPNDAAGRRSLGRPCGRILATEKTANEG
jgi:hypothetical protein